MPSSMVYKSEILVIPILLTVFSVCVCYGRIGYYLVRSHHLIIFMVRDVTVPDIDTVKNVGSKRESAGHSPGCVLRGPACSDSCPFSGVHYQWWKD